MHNAIDFSSWQAVLSTLLGIAVFSLVAIGIRLLVMQTVQQRRERENRQINERLRTLIAAYKTLGGSFTGNLVVDPAHWRDLKREAEAANAPGAAAIADIPTSSEAPRPQLNFDRRRRVRDAVEAALSDIILLGTEEQVRLAATAATDMASGRPVETAALVISLRTFIREVLDLDPVPSEVVIPKQGPSRPGSAAGRTGREDRGNARSGGRGAGGQGGGGAGGFVGTIDHEVHRPDGEGHG